MKPLLGHILLALAWLLLTGEFTFGNFVLGLSVGLAVLWLAGDLIGARRYVRRIGSAVQLLGTLLREMVVANVRVTIDVITPHINATPAIARVDLDATSDIEILLVSMLLTLTPGTVVVHITEDRRHMYVYGMYVRDMEAFRRRIKRTFEGRVLAVTREQS